MRLAEPESKRFAAVFFFFATLVSASTAQDSTAARTWLEEAIHRANAFPEHFESLDIKWIVRSYISPSPSDLAKLKEEVKDRPDHPERDLIDNYERALAGIPYEYVGRLLIDTPTRWRYCESYSLDDENSVYSDECRTDSASFSLTSSAIVLFDPANYPVDHSPEVVIRRLGTDGSLLLTQGLIRFKNNQLQLEAFEVDGHTWKATAQRRAGSGRSPRFRLEFSGTAFTEDRQVQIEHIRTVQNEFDARSVGELLQFSRWQWETIPQSYVPHALDWKYPDGRLRTHIELVHIISRDKDYFEKAFRIPTTGSTDSLRGVVHANEIVDLRSGFEVITTPHGRVTQPSTIQRSVSQPMKALGWALAAVTSILLYWAVKRKLSSHSPVLYKGPLS